MQQTLLSCERNKENYIDTEKKSGLTIDEGSRLSSNY